MYIYIYIERGNQSSSSECIVERASSTSKRRHLFAGPRVILADEDISETRKYLVSHESHAESQCLYRLQSTKTSESAKSCTRFCRELITHENTYELYYSKKLYMVFYVCQGKYFMLRVNEKNSADRTHGFETPSRGACRHLFRCCIDHQAFFRLMATGPPPLSPYSRFRSYSPPIGQLQHGSDKQQQVWMPLSTTRLKPRLYIVVSLYIYTYIYTIIWRV